MNNPKIDAMLERAGLRADLLANMRDMVEHGAVKPTDHMSDTITEIATICTDKTIVGSLKEGLRKSKAANAILLMKLDDLDAVSDPQEIDGSLGVLQGEIDLIAKERMDDLEAVLGLLSKLKRSQ